MRQTSRLRKLLSQKDIIIAPGAADALVARIIEKAGFNALYLTGAGVSYTTLGLPDVGLITMTEMVTRAENICSVVNLPVIADGDTGYGNALNVSRTVRAYERAGVAAIQLEDQVFPKHCGHMAGKQLISRQEMVGKIKAALDARTDHDFVVIARTDARGVTGLADALERAQAYEEAGADVIFVEAPESVEEMRRITSAVQLPTLANMVEGGKTPLLSASELQNIGYKIVIFPNTAIRSLIKTVTEVMQELHATGTTKGLLNRMLTFNELNALLGLNRVREQEQRYAAID
ncbi:carboxyvinyl-carboxyphosphonate phosphorylmutase [Clostridiales bacterium PH28_bin88]|nr:carboxyvinyl-carboxyphosphonate phosphorylmutase [Clostridiales bacterium PH28_bin88]